MHLFGAELAAFSVGKEPVEASYDVVDLKSDRGQASGAGIQLVTGQRITPAVNVFPRKFQSV